VEDAQNRAEIKLKRAVEEVKKLLIPAVSICVQVLDCHFHKLLLKYNYYHSSKSQAPERSPKVKFRC